MKLNVLFHVGYHANLFSPIDRELGGTEQVLLNTVKYLAKEFNVYVTGDVAEMSVDGVEYINRELLWKTPRTYDVVIGVGYIHFLLDLENKVKYNKTYLWIHNTEYYPYYKGETLPDNGKYLLPKLSGIICVSEWHKKQISEKYDYPLDKTQVIYNSVNTIDFDEDVEKIKDSFIYSSHPERGLNTLLELWYYIKDIKPNATLKVFCPKYGLDVFNQTYKKLNLKDVHFIGNVDAKTLRQEYSKAEYWFYPTQYEETFCITAVEAQLAGCKIITSPIGALPEIIPEAEFIKHPGEELGYYLDKIKVIDFITNNDRLTRNKAHASIFKIDVIGKLWKYLINSCYSFDCVYIISLNKTDEYKQDALKRLKESNIEYESVAFIDGIDGRNPNPGFDFKPWDGWKIGNEYEQNRIDKKFNDESKFHQRDITPGEIGCVLSHIKCWKDAYINNFNSVLILEEDFYFTEKFNPTILSTLSNWDLIYLGRNLIRNLPEQNHNAYFVRPLFSYNAHSYALSKNGVDIIISKHLENNLIPTDEFLPTLYDTHFRQDIINLLEKNDKRKLNAFATTIDYVIQKDNKSQTENIHLLPVVEETKFTINIMDKQYTPLHPELYQYWDDTSSWHKKFLVPGMIKKEWDLFVDEELDSVFTYPLFTTDFCNKLIEEAEHAKVWTYARHEFYPTTDFVLTEIGFDKIYYDLLWEFVMPMAIHKFGLEGKGWDQLAAENFLARYSPDTQGHLSIHHDNAHITALVNLSSTDDYVGGGTWFWRQKKLSRPPQGYVSVHPGNITHKHGARPIMSGKRYIIVSFMKNKEY